MRATYSAHISLDLITLSTFGKVQRAILTEVFLLDIASSDECYHNASSVTFQRLISFDADNFCCS